MDATVEDFLVFLRNTSAGGNASRVSSYLLRVRELCARRVVLRTKVVENRKLSVDSLLNSEALESHYPTTGRALAALHKLLAGRSTIYHGKAGRAANAHRHAIAASAILRCIETWTHEALGGARDAAGRLAALRVRYFDGGEPVDGCDPTRSLDEITHATVVSPAYLSWIDKAKAIGLVRSRRLRQLVQDHAKVRWAELHVDLELHRMPSPYVDMATETIEQGRRRAAFPRSAPRAFNEAEFLAEREQARNDHADWERAREEKLNEYKAYVQAKRQKLQMALESTLPELRRVFEARPFANDEAWEWITFAPWTNADEPNKESIREAWPFARELNRLTNADDLSKEAEVRDELGRLLTQPKGWTVLGEPTTVVDEEAALYAWQRIEDAGLAVEAMACALQVLADEGKHCIAGPLRCPVCCRHLGPGQRVYCKEHASKAKERVQAGRDAKLGTTRMHLRSKIEDRLQEHAAALLAPFELARTLWLASPPRKVQPPKDNALRGEVSSLRGRVAELKEFVECLHPFVGDPLFGRLQRLSGDLCTAVARGTASADMDDLLPDQFLRRFFHGPRLTKNRLEGEIPFDPRHPIGNDPARRISFSEILRDLVEAAAWLETGGDDSATSARNSAKGRRGRPPTIDKNRAFEMWQSCCPNVEIAAEFGVSAAAVTLFFQRQGLSKRPATPLAEAKAVRPARRGPRA